MTAPFHYHAFIARLRSMGLNGVRAGRGMLFQCPAHPDRNPSMKVDWSDREPDHAVLVDCKSGCKPVAICTAMGDPTMKSLYPAREQTNVFVGEPRPVEQPKAEPPAPLKLTPTDTYTYTDVKGTPLSLVIRSVDEQGKKHFKQCRADGVPSLEGVPRVLYRLHEWQNKKDLFFAEGEKDVDNLRKWGIAATTNMGGARSWRPEYMQQVKDAGVKRLTIFVDNDEPGKAHGHVIAAAAHAAGITARIIVPPGVPEKGDISDWIAAGGTIDQLREIVKRATYWRVGDDAEYIKAEEPKAEEKKRYVKRPRKGTDLSDKKPSYLIEGVVPDSMFGEIAGRDGRGKSLLGMEIARCVLTGEALFGEFEVKRTGPVLLIMLDDPEWLVRDRLESLKIADHPGLHVLTLADVDMSNLAAVLQEIADLCMEIKPLFVLIDALYLFVPDSKGSSDPTNNQGTMRPIMQAFDKISNISDATVGLVAHENKAGTDVQGSQAIRNMAKWILRLALPAEFEKDISGGKVTPHRVLQLEKTKIAAAAQWGLRLEGAGKWVRCEIEAKKSAKQKRAEERERIIEWLKFFLEPGPKTTAEVREASFMDGNRFPWHVVNSPAVADEAGIEKTHASPEAPWMWALRKEQAGDKVPAVQPQREGEGAQGTLPLEAGSAGAGAGEAGGA